MAAVAKFEPVHAQIKYIRFQTWSCQNVFKKILLTVPSFHGKFQVAVYIKRFRQFHGRPY